MKDIDQEIDSFEKNLNQINDLKNQISNLKTSLEKELKDVTTIEEIKNNINQELQNIKIGNENNKKVIEKQTESINVMFDELKDLLKKEISQNVENINKKQNMLEKKLIITNIIVIVGFILTIMLNLMFR